MGDRPAGAGERNNQRIETAGKARSSSRSTASSWMGSVPLDREAVGRAVEAELGGRLADTVSADWAAVAVDGLSTTSNLRLVSGERSWSVGGQIARSVCRTLADGGALQESGRMMGPWRSPSRPA